MADEPSRSAKPERHGLSTEVSFDRETPNNSLPELPPRVSVETPRTLKKAIAVNAALGEFKGVESILQNSAITLLRAIVVQEAKHSSEIENIVTTNDELYRVIDDERATDPFAKEVIGYSNALWYGYEELCNGRPLSTTLFTEIASVIRRTQVDVRKMPGTKLTNPSTGETTYTPPDGEALIRSLLKNLCDFIAADDDIDPLIKMAVVHYQFEAIHPFRDGNGRTGRILSILLLVEKGLTKLPVLYISRFIIRNKSEYYRLLRAVTEEGNWEDWIVFMLDVVEKTVADATRVMREIQQATDDCKAKVQSLMSIRTPNELVDLIFEQPVTRIRYVTRRGLAKRQTASHYLQELERIGVMESRKVGRDVLYINRRLMDILTE
ncbi:MAG: Fic family protein [Armatimonadetes bacterium]|nr:Fic family protein [Armatimonadota bacterium]